ncbi:DUF2802 domain-containing protein [Pseudoalteromonas fenneropenaei]|uniref:DUF2802 domain-containing protein n=1 Tax=Pseudoalteromonas fenneropenaei TaxID=1737459 RepID=A0ABV7CGK0_9GAMM
MIIIGLLVASCALSCVCLGLFYAARKNTDVQRKQIIQQHKHNEALAQQLQILRSEIAEVRAGVLSMSKRIVACEQGSQELAQALSAQKYDDPDARIYSRAVKMIELGADIEEVMRECELPRAEAELLMTLHNKGG